MNELLWASGKAMNKQLSNSLEIALVNMICILLTSEYHVKTGTTDNAFAGTNANVWIKIKGEKGVTRKLLLDNPGKDDFQQGA